MDAKLIENCGYVTALEKVLVIRKKRKDIYGDSFKDDPDWALLAEIRQKYLRLLKFILNPEITLYENLEDTLIDLTNYSLFLLQNKLDNHE